MKNVETMQSKTKPLTKQKEKNQIEKNKPKNRQRKKIK